MAELLMALEGVVASLKGEQRNSDAAMDPMSAAQSPFQALLSARRAEVVQEAMTAWADGARIDHPPAAIPPVAASLRTRPHGPLPDPVDTSPVPATAAHVAQRAVPAAADATMVQPSPGANVPAVGAEGEPDPEAAKLGRAPIDQRGRDDWATVLPASSAVPVLHPMPAAPAVALAVEGVRAPAIPAPNGQALPAAVSAPAAEVASALAGPQAPGSGGGGADAAPDPAVAAVLPPVNGAAELRLTAGDDAPPAVQSLRALDSLVRGGDAKVHLVLETPLRGQAFAAELSDKLVWLAGRQGQWAALSLNPPHLGNVEVRLTLTGGEASAQFFSAQPAVRDALEAALPRLRELMAGAGIQLGDAQVRDQAFSGRDDAPRFTVPLTAAARFAMSSADEPMRPHLAGRGLIDLYA